MWPVRLAFAMLSIMTLTGCVVAPYPYSYGYAPGYYAPGYVAAPPVVVGWGWGRGRW